MRMLLLMLCTLVFTSVQAQKKKTFKVSPGEKVADVVPQNEKYTYTDFTSGNVYFRNETYYPVKLNYNALFDEMQFISEKGDTLALADENTIKVIVIDKDSFYYQKGYLKQLKKYGEVLLAVKHSFYVMNRQKIGGMGEVSSSSIETYNSISSSNSGNSLSSSNYFKQLVAKEILTIAKKTTYFIGDEFGNFREIGKKSLLDFYAKKEKGVQEYLKNNKPDFSSEAGIMKMLEHISALPVE
jgi:translation elongation factor P/translation initiation factor 5A